MPGRPSSDMALQAVCFWLLKGSYDATHSIPEVLIRYPSRERQGQTHSQFLKRLIKTAVYKELISKSESYTFRFLQPPLRAPGSVHRQHAPFNRIKFGFGNRRLASSYRLSAVNVASSIVRVYQPNPETRSMAITVPTGVLLPNLVSDESQILVNF